MFIFVYLLPIYCQFIATLSMINISWFKLMKLFTHTPKIKFIQICCKLDKRVSVKYQMKSNTHSKETNGLILWCQHIYQYTLRNLNISRIVEIRLLFQSSKV